MQFGPDATLRGSGRYLRDHSRCIEKGQRATELLVLSGARARSGCIDAALLAPIADPTSRADRSRYRSVGSRVLARMAAGTARSHSDAEEAFEREGEAF